MHRKEWQKRKLRGGLLLLLLLLLVCVWGLLCACTAIPTGVQPAAPPAARLLTGSAELYCQTPIHLHFTEMGGTLEKRLVTTPGFVLAGTVLVQLDVNEITRQIQDMEASYAREQRILRINENSVESATISLEVAKTDVALDQQTPRLEDTAALQALRQRRLQYQVELAELSLENARLQLNNQQAQCEQMLTRLTRLQEQGYQLTTPQEGYVLSVLPLTATQRIETQQTIALFAPLPDVRIRCRPDFAVPYAPGDYLWMVIEDQRHEMQVVASPEAVVDETQLYLVFRGSAPKNVPMGTFSVAIEPQ